MIRNLITAAKTLFPKEVTFAGSGWTRLRGPYPTCYTHVINERTEALGAE